MKKHYLLIKIEKLYPEKCIKHLIFDGNINASPNISLV